MTQHVYDIKDFYLLLDGKKYQLLKADVGYAVGTYPSCVVTITTGGLLNTGTASTLEWEKLVQIRTLAKVMLTYSYNGGETATICLFQGRIASDAYDLFMASVAVRSTMVIKLVFDAEYLNAIPPGALQYLAVAGSISLVDFNLISESTKSDASVMRIEPELVTKNMAAAIVDSADALKTILDAGSSAQDKEQLSLRNCLDVSDVGPMTLPISNTGKMLEYIRVMLVQTMAQSSYMETVLAVLRTFFLNVVPDMRIVKNPSREFKFRVMPVVGWRKDVSVTLTPDDYIGTSASTTHKLNTHIDAFAIPLPYNNANIINQCAVYGEGFTKNGEPVIFTSGNNLVPDGPPNADNKKDTRVFQTYSRIHAISFPKWILEGNFFPPDRETIPSKPPLKGVTADPYDFRSQQGESINQITRFGKLLVISAFLTMGRAQRSLQIQAPFGTFLKTHEHLGKTVCIQTLIPVVASTRDIRDLKSVPMYGLLSAVSLRIELTDGSVSVNTSLSITHLRNSADNERYGASKSDRKKNFYRE